jgi:hypothetical protein
MAAVAVLVIGLITIRPSRQHSTTAASTSAPEVFGTGASSAPDAKSAAGSASSGDPALNAGGVQSTPSLGASRSASLPGAPAAPAASASQATPATPSIATKIVKTGSVNLQVGKGTLSSVVNQLTSLAGGLGGYVSNAQTAEGGGAPTGDLTMRVPVDQFETLLTRTRSMGKPTAVSTSGQDVTASYVDLGARIQALQDTRTQYLQILAKATAIGDILSVEQQLSDLQTQIEQLQGQQMVLADQTSFATLSVHLSEPGALTGAISTPPGGLAKAWSHARSSFAHAVEAVIGASGGVLVFLVCVALLLLVCRLAWPFVRRRLV